MRLGFCSIALAILLQQGLDYILLKTDMPVSKNWVLSYCHRAKKIISFPKLAPNATLSVLVFKLWKYVSLIPDINQRCFFIQNEAMDISFKRI